MLNSYFNFSSNVVAGQRSFPTSRAAGDSSPSSVVGHETPRDVVELSREVGSEQATSEGVNSLLQAMLSWEEPEPTPAKSSLGRSKQGGQVVNTVQAAWNSPVARGTRTALGAEQALNPENSTCQRVAGGISSVSGAASYSPFPQVQAVARGGQVVGGVMTWVACPLIDGLRRHTPTEVAEIRRIRERLNRNPPPAPFPGAARWNPSVAGAGR